MASDPNHDPQTGSTDTTGSTGTTGNPTRDAAGRIVDAALALAAERDWRATTLGEVAAAAGVGLAELYRHFPDKPAILDGLARQVDAQVLAGGPADLEERPRDRLFDVLMRRFDALAPYKDGLRAVTDDLRGDPMAALAGFAKIRNSMGWMLEAAGLPSDGVAGALRAKGLAVVWTSLLPVWFRDDSGDMAKTMAALDARLRRAEEIWNSVRQGPAGFRSRRRSGDAAGQTAATS